MAANVPPGEKVPTHSPIFPDLKTESIAKLEVHIQYTDSEGDKVWAEVPGLPVYASWEDIRARAGGGFFKVGAKGSKNNYIGQDRKRLHGPAKFLNEVRDAEETEDDEDADIDDAKSDVRAIIKQQSEILPAAFNAVTTALVQTSDRHAERMAGMVQTQSSMVSSHAASLDAMQRSHRAEIDGYRAELTRLQNLLIEREKKIDELTGQNAGFLKTLASAKSGNEIVAAISELGPKLPGLMRGMREAFKSETPQLGAGGPTPPVLSFGAR